MGEREDCRRRHVVHYTSLLRHFADRFLTSEQVPLYWALVPERENLRAALGYALDGGGVGAVGLTAVMWSYWTCAGQPREAGHWMDLALELAPEPSADRFTTLVWSCTYATYRGEHQAARRFADEAQAVADFTETLDLLGSGASLSLLAWVSAQDGRYPRAAWLFGAASAVWALAGAVPFVGNPKLGALHTRFDAAARQALGDQRCESPHRQGATLPRRPLIRGKARPTDTSSHEEGRPGDSRVSPR